MTLSCCDWMLPFGLTKHLLIFPSILRNDKGTLNARMGTDGVVHFWKSGGFEDFKIRASTIRDHGGLTPACCPFCDEQIISDQ